MRGQRNRTVYPIRLIDLPHLSKSSIEMFEQCPYRWVSEYLFGQRDRALNKYAAIGIAAHNLIEQKLRQEPLSHEEIAKITDKNEKTNVLKFINGMKPRKTIGIEHEFKVKFRDDAPPILGYIDHFHWHDFEDNAIVIEDWKTNREFEGIEKWRRNLQPQVYSYAIRKMYPDITAVYYSVGYLILNKEVTWRTSADEDHATVLRLNNAWDNMVEIVGGMEKIPILDNIPQRLGDHCRWCKVKQSCATFRNAVHNFTPEIINDLVSTPIERWIKLNQIKSLLDGLVEEAKEEVVEEIKAKGPISHDGVTWKLESTKTRKLSFVDFMESLKSAAESGRDDIWMIVKDRIEDLVTIKIGEVDKLIEDVPEVGACVRKKITMKESKLSLKEEKAKKKS